MMTVLTVVSLGDLVRRAGGKRETVDLGIVMFGERAADGVMAGVAVVPLFVGVERGDPKSFGYLVRGISAAEGEVCGAFQIQRLQFESGRHFVGLAILDEKSSAVAFAFGKDMERLAARRFACAHCEWLGARDATKAECQQEDVTKRGREQVELSDNKGTQIKHWSWQGWLAARMARPRRCAG